MAAKAQPQKVRLTEDYLDFAAEVAHAKGTVLGRRSGGHYATPETRLGQGNCVASFGLIEGACEILD